MIDNEQPDAPQVRNNRQNRGVPRFMSTFADLMTLLLCFFVLLVAMAEIDALKYKMVVRSMADAFGVDTPSPEDEIVKGTSVIQQTFSPAITDPVPAPDVRQDPLSDAQSLRVEDAEHYRAVRLSTLASRLEQALETGLREGQLSIETLPDRVMIRISEQASFPSASAELKPAFLPVLGDIADALSGVEGALVVAGHSDNVPLRAGPYRSNWELSAARATSVVHALLEKSGLAPERFRIEGYGDTRPLTDNSTPALRAINRRVEIGIII